MGTGWGWEQGGGKIGDNVRNLGFRLVKLRTGLLGGGNGGKCGVMEHKLKRKVENITRVRKMGNF